MIGRLGEKLELAILPVLLLVMGPIIVLYFFSGTGSKPPLAKGLHRIILFILSQSPFIGPYSIKASLQYSLQVGTYLHDAGRWGDMPIWYSLTKANISFSSKRAGK